MLWGLALQKLSFFPQLSFGSGLFGDHALKKGVKPDRQEALVPADRLPLTEWSPYFAVGFFVAQSVLLMLA